MQLWNGIVMPLEASCGSSEGVLGDLPVLGRSVWVACGRVGLGKRIVFLAEDSRLSIGAAREAATVPDQIVRSQS